MQFDSLCMSRTKYVTLSIIFWSHWVRVKVWRNCLLWCCQTIARVSKILLLVTAVRIVYFYDWQLMLILWQGGLIRLVPPTSYFFLDRWDWGMLLWQYVGHHQPPDTQSLNGRKAVTATIRMTNIFQLVLHCFLAITHC